MTNGTETTSYTYDGMGRLTAETGTFDNPIRYAGEYYDAESGNIYLRARYYDPTCGRFLSEDPVKDGQNWYSYCGGNPVNFVDFWGLARVMLRYAVEKYGTVNYNEATGMAEVTIGNVTRYYRTETINDRMIIDTEVLSADFGIKASLFEHRVDDEFYSEEDAILAFALTYHPKAQQERQEYAATIVYRNGMYVMAQVTNSSLTAGKQLDQLDDFERNQVRHIYDDNAVAHVHTHWNADGNLTFTNPDDYKISRENHIYLVNRYGQVFMSRKTSNLKLGYTTPEFVFGI